MWNHVNYLINGFVTHGRYSLVLREMMLRITPMGKKYPGRGEFGGVLIRMSKNMHQQFFADLKYAHRVGCVAESSSLCATSLLISSVQAT